MDAYIASYDSAYQSELAEKKLLELGFPICDHNRDVVSRRDFKITDLLSEDDLKDLEDEYQLCREADERDLY